MKEKFKADLHNHSNYSDGKYSPAKLVKMAKENNVTIMALTDHDTVLGVSEAIEAGNKYGVKVIGGIELSTFYKGKLVHIIGLFKNNDIPKSMYDFSINYIETRKSRALLMMEKIKELYGYNIDINDLLNDSKANITRGNMARSLLKSNPSLTKEKLDECIGNNSKAYIPVSKLESKDGIKFLKDNNCLVILAHPTLINHEVLDEVLKLNYDAIEARYYANKENEEEYFTKVAKDYNKLISSGSDFHTEDCHSIIGSHYLTKEEFQPILDILNI